MDHDMFVLAERLVIAMEIISQDVKSMSTYVYDISCSVSDLLNEKRQRECVSVKADDGSDNDTSVASVTGQEASEEREYTGQDEQVEERSLLHIGDPEHQESLCGDNASMAIDTHENSDFLPSESKTVFTYGVKLEEHSEDDVHDELCDMQNVYGNNRNIDAPWSEVQSEAHYVTEGQNEASGVHTTFRKITEHMTPSDLLKTTEDVSSLVQQCIESVETASNSAVNSDSTIHITRCPEDHGSVPETQKVIRACALEGHSVHYEPEDTDRVDGKLLRGYMNDSEEPHQESCRAAGASSSSSEHKLIHDGKEKEEQREMGISAGERGYRAQKKGKASAKKSHLGQSGRQKRSRGPFRCDTCGKCFTSKLNLETHRRIHTGERPFHCTLCNKTCSSKSNLKVHMSVHSEERPYKCSTCDKSFKEKSYLKSHLQVHSGEKPFICRECGKAFTHSCTLKCHMRQHSGEKPFICTECGKSFTDNSNLFTHMRTHTGERPFTCEDCGSSFTQSNNLKRHRCTVHGVASPVS